MASDVDVCNMALAHLGAESLISSLSPPDGSAEAGYCKIFYPQARRMAIEAMAWTFAKTRVELAEVANPSTVWLYAYAMPSDCVSPLRVLNTTSLAGLLVGFDSTLMFGTDAYWATFFQLTEAGSANFEIEGTTLLTNEPEATLIYLKDITNVNRWTATFTMGVSQLLAGLLAGPIIKGTAAINIGKAWTDSGLATLGRAAADDANGTSERSDFIPPSIQARA